ncbi:MAG: ester cyclase [Silanimonas sp.]
MAVMLAALLPALPPTTVAAASTAETTPRDVVLGFLEEVRSGKHPERAADYLAPRVLAHQLLAEAPATVERTPENYADHVREFLATWGAYDFEVVELLADGPRVYARWQQTGTHLREVEGIAPTGRRIVELTSAVYRVEDGRIVEYWIQPDRLGLQRQLEASATAD